jgi:hypothetical protein
MAGDLQFVARQHARVVVEQPVIASLDVTQGIRQQKSISILQGKSR